jgi:23S rRNA pseudouridine2605 synthase
MISLRRFMGSEVPMPGVHISQYLTKIGVCSRRKAVQYLDQRRIAINHPDTLMDTKSPLVNEGDKVYVNGELVSNRKPLILPSERAEIDSINQRFRESGVRIEDQLNSPVRLWLFYKRRRQLCTEYDPKRRPTVSDYLETYYPEITGKNRLLMVGRLDYHAEGLMLLTNCGELKRRLEHPSNLQSRVYLACIKGSIPEALFGKLREGFRTRSGIQVPGVKIVEAADDNVDSTLHKLGGEHWIRVVTDQDQASSHLRAAMEHWGLELTRLVRIQFGEYMIEERLKQGALIPSDINHLPLPVPAPIVSEPKQILKPRLHSNHQRSGKFRSRQPTKSNLSSNWI